MNKLIKGILIFLSIFTLIAVGTTYILITNNTQNLLKENDNIHEIKAETGIDLYSMYNENDLLINELLETYGGKEIKIPQIDGLKNVEIQNKINKDMYNRIYEQMDTLINADDGSINELDIGYTAFNINANFSNIISIDFFVSERNKLYRVCFNYNLVTGERLKLEDIFIKDTDILEIVRDAYRESLANYSYSYEFIDDNNIAIFDENELYKIVKGYMSNEEKDFVISPSSISFYFNNSVASVDLIDIADKVSIYTKYLTNESIYERNDIGRKNIFTLVKTNYEIFDTIDYGYLEDNFWYDVTVGKMYFPDGRVEDEKMQKFNAYAQSITNEVYNSVNEYREKAKENPNKFYLLICTPNISMYNGANYANGEWTYTYSNMAITNISTKVYEMPIELYNSEYKDKIIEGYRHQYFVMRGGMYYTIDEPSSGDEVVYTNEVDKRKYNYMTNEEITDLSDIFHEDINYMKTVEEIVHREISERYQYSESEIEELLKHAKYDFEGWNIKVDIPQIEYFSLSIYLETFDKSMLNIFDEED